MTQDAQAICRQLLDCESRSTQELLRTAPDGPITSFTRNWLVLLEDFLHLQEKTGRLRERLDDKVLSSMVEARANGLAASLKHRIYDLATIQSQEMLDVCCKCLVLDALIERIPAGEAMSDLLRASIQRDIRDLDLVPSARTTRSGQ